MGHSEHESTIEALREMLASAMGSRIGVACVSVNGDPQNLYPEERALISQAVLHRQREFAAGRAAARQAMTQVGLSPCAVPSGPDRAPIWPLGVVGSISHTRQICIAATGRAEEVGAIGIDVEERKPVDQSLWPSICTSGEQTYLDSQPVEQRGDIVTQLFSAKEAFFKWQYPATRRMLDFQDIHVTLDPKNCGFQVRHIDAIQWPEALNPITGCMFSGQEWVIAWVCGHLERPRVGFGNTPS